MTRTHLNSNIVDIKGLIDTSLKQRSFDNQANCNVFKLFAVLNRVYPMHLKPYNQHC